MAAHPSSSNNMYSHHAANSSSSNLYSTAKPRIMTGQGSSGSLRAARQAATAAQGGSALGVYSRKNGMPVSPHHQQQSRQTYAQQQQNSSMSIGRERVDGMPPKARAAQTLPHGGHRETNASPGLFDTDDEEYQESNEKHWAQLAAQRGLQHQQRANGTHRAQTPDDDYDDIYGHYAEIDHGNYNSAMAYKTNGGPGGGGGRNEEVGFDSLTSDGSPYKEKRSLERNQSTTTSASRWLPRKNSSTASKAGSKHSSKRRKGSAGVLEHTRGMSSTLERALPPLASPAAARFGWLPQTWATRLFLLVTLAEAAADISIEAVLLARFRDTRGSIHRQGGTLAPLPVFLLVFGFAHIYQCFLAVDSVMNRNTILVMGLVMFNLAFFVYAIIQITEIRDVLGDGVAKGSSQTVPVQVLTGAIPVIIGVGTICLAILGWLLMKEFGWQIYKTIGADRRLKRAHLHYQIYVCLLKFDFFMFIAFCLQLVLVVLSKETAEYWITMFAAPVALILLVFAWYSVRQEMRWGMLVFMSGCVGGAVYFTYKLFRIWQQKNTTYTDVYKSLTVFSVLALALLCATFIMSIRCMMNFGHGLKTALSRAAEEKKRSNLEEPLGPVISAPYHSQSKNGQIGASYPPLPQYDGRVTSPPYHQSYTSPTSGGGMAMLTPPRAGISRSGAAEPVDYFDVYGSGHGGMAMTRDPSNHTGMHQLSASNSTNALLPQTSPSSIAAGLSKTPSPLYNYRSPSAARSPMDRYDSRRNLKQSVSNNRLSLD